MDGRDGLLASLYAGISDGERMQRFVQGLSSAVGCHSGSLTVRDLTRRRHLSVVAAGAMADAATVERFNTESGYVTDNLWFNRATARMRPGVVLVGDELASTSEIRQTRYYRDFLRQIDTMHTVALVASTRPDAVAILTFCGSAHRGAFTPGELALCRAIAPHWVNAFRLQRNVARASRNRSVMATYMLDGDMRLISASPAGEVLLRASVLRLAKGRTLEPSHPASRAAWGAAIRQLTASACPGAGDVCDDVIPFYADGGTLAGFGSLRPYGLHAAGAGVPEFVLTIDILARGTSQALGATLKRLFRLTDAEVALVLALRSEGDLALAAEICGIGTASARTRLQSIYEKTGTHRQLELQRMLDTLDGVLAAPPFEIGEAP